MAADARLDRLRSLMQVRENPGFTRQYYEPDKRYIGNAVQVFFRDGSHTDRVQVDVPIGHRARRSEGLPLLMQKFAGSVAAHFGPRQAAAINALAADSARLERMAVHELVAALVKNG